MSFTVGLDLGQASDFTALAVLETPTLRVARWEERSDVWTNDDADSFDFGHAYHSTSHVPIFTAPDGTETEDHPPLVHELRHLDRWRGVPYPEIVSKVRGILSRLPTGTDLVVDATGVGAPVVDLFRSAGLAPVAVSIHGGDKVTQEDSRTFRVPKRDLVGSVAVLLETSRLRVAAALPQARLLVDELRNFRVKIDPATAHDSYSAWRDADHDDLVLAAALAAWHAERNAHAPGAWSVGASEMSWGATF